jgi:hypothetical protein
MIKETIKKIREKSYSVKNIDLGDYVLVGDKWYLVSAIFSSDEIYILDEKSGKEKKISIKLVKDVRKDEKIKEAKDTSVDYSEQFQIAIIPKEEAIVIKQLFGYFTKYPIYIKDQIDEEIRQKIKQIKNYDVDVIAVTTIGGKDDISLQISVNVDSKELDDVLNFNIVLNNGKESVRKV